MEETAGLLAMRLRRHTVRLSVIHAGCWDMCAASKVPASDRIVQTVLTCSAVARASAAAPVAAASSDRFWRAT